MPVSFPFIYLSSDFGVDNKGIGVMEAVALNICPTARVIHMSHGIPHFSIRQGARMLEASAYLPIGFHVCVVDPGVGTARKGIIIETGRGDYLIGPDNGVLIPATWFLNGIKRVVQITNEKYMLKPVSPVFHGRDVFTPAAAHLANGVRMNEFGSELNSKELVKPPYEDARVEDNKIEAEIIDVNDFGSPFLNVRQVTMHQLFTVGDVVRFEFNGKELSLPYVRTYGDVPMGELLILDDDFGRMEIAINQGEPAKKYGLSIGAKVILRKS